MVQLRWIVFVGSFLITFSNTGKCMEGKDLDFPLFDRGAIQRSLHYLRDLAESPPVIANVCYEKGESFSDFKAKLEKEKRRFPQGQHPKLFSMDLSQVVFHQKQIDGKTNIDDLHYISTKYHIHIHDLKLSILTFYGNKYYEAFQDITGVIWDLKNCFFIESLHLRSNRAIPPFIRSAEPSIYLSFPTTLRKLTWEGEELGLLDRGVACEVIENCLNYLTNLEELEISGTYPADLFDFISTLNLPRIKVLKIRADAGPTAASNTWYHKEQLEKLKRLDPRGDAFPALKELELEGFFERITYPIEKEKRENRIWKLLSEEVLAGFKVKEIKESKNLYNPLMIFKKEDDKKSIF